MGGASATDKSHQRLAGATIGETVPAAAEIPIKLDYVRLWPCQSDWLVLSQAAGLRLRSHGKRRRLRSEGAHATSNAAP